MIHAVHFEVPELDEYLKNYNKKNRCRIPTKLDREDTLDIFLNKNILGQYDTWEEGEELKELYNKIPNDSVEIKFFEHQYTHHLRIGDLVYMRASVTDCYMPDFSPDIRLLNSYKYFPATWKWKFLEINDIKSYSFEELTLILKKVQL